MNKLVRTSRIFRCVNAKLNYAIPFPSRCFSVDNEQSQPAVTRIYEGNFGSKLRSIRRLSAMSSIVSTIGFPIAISLGNSTVMPLAGQIAMATTIIITSLSSTLFLQLVCHPYVTELDEIPSAADIKANGSSKVDRRFRAKRLNIFGQSVVTEFNASEVNTIKQSIHPFASFKVGETVYYVHKGSVTDPTLKAIF